MTYQKNKPMKNKALAGGLALLLAVGSPLSPTAAHATWIKNRPNTVQVQQKAIGGTVTSATDQSPLPGVSVIIKGSTKGVTTDENGRYKIEATSTDVLVFSYIGFNKA